VLKDPSRDTPAETLLQVCQRQFACQSVFLLHLPQDRSAWRDTLAIDH